MMRSPLASRTLAFAFVLTLAACGGGASGTGGAGGTGGGAPCVTAADCPQPENDCQLAACDAGACGLEPKPEGAICLQGAGTCDGNGQCNLCEPGFATCNGSTLLVCGDSGTFDDPITCNGDTPYCNPADPKCVGCFDTSQCVTPGMNPCLAVACLDNACVTTLVPDGSACVSNGATGVCSDGVCLQCAPGDQTCSGDSLLTCGPDGMFDAAPCGGATPLCDPAALACVECVGAGDCGAAPECTTWACISGVCEAQAAPETCVDSDMDGIRAFQDCDDSSASLGAIANDKDCDGFGTAADCNDSDASVHPFAGDVYADSLDQDCDGLDCSAGWHGSAYFAVCAKPSDWTAAAADCVSAGYDGLASILSMTEQLALETRLPQFQNLGQGNSPYENFWMGLHDEAGQGSLVWPSGAPLSGYTNWMVGEPGSSPPGEDCAAIAEQETNYDWFLAYCATVRTGFVCEHR